MQETKPSRCIDTIIKFCQECEWGWTKYPEWVETYDDLKWCTIESGCMLGYDQGRPEDEPTPEELAEFYKWYEKQVFSKADMEEQHEEDFI